MTQVPILKGVYTNNAGDFRQAYPRNMVPIAMEQGISTGYLRPGDGLVEFGTGPGTDRGGINWDGVCYRVMGTKLITIGATGTITVLGDVGSGGQVSLDYSFDRLAIASGTRLYYYRNGTLTQVTDPDLGIVIDMLWVDGYFMTTDGEFLVVTELNDPTSVDPLKYGSSEVDPDPIMGLIKLRDEVYALNRYTTEIFQNVGGDTFPFQRVDGALIQRGAIGTYAKALLLDQIVFLGSGRNEAPAIWIASNGQSETLSDREIEQILGTYTEAQLSTAILEARVTDGQKLLYVHLPDQTLVYNATASQLLQTKVWYQLTSSLVGLGQYRAKNFVWCYDKWLCGDPTSSKHGYISLEISSHYGEINGWEVYTAILYNGGNSAIINEIELVALPGRAALGVNPTIWTSYSWDGQTFSQEKPRGAGKIGERLKRLTWFNQGFIEHWRIQKFRGTSESQLSIARLEMQIEALEV